MAIMQILIVSQPIPTQHQYSKSLSSRKVQQQLQNLQTSLINTKSQIMEFLSYSLPPSGSTERYKIMLEAMAKDSDGGGSSNNKSTNPRQ